MERLFDHMQDFQTQPAHPGCTGWPTGTGPRVCFLKATKDSQTLHLGVPPVASSCWHFWVFFIALRMVRSKLHALLTPICLQKCSSQPRWSRENDVKDLTRSIFAKRIQGAEAPNCLQRDLHADTPQCSPESLHIPSPPPGAAQCDKHQWRAPHYASFKSPLSQSVPKAFPSDLWLPLGSHNLQYSPQGVLWTFLSKKEEASSGYALGTMELTQQHPRCSVHRGQGSAHVFLHSKSI